MLFGLNFNLAALLSIAALLSRVPTASCSSDGDLAAYERGYTDGVRDLHRRSYYEDGASYYRRAPQARPAVDDLFKRDLDPPMLFQRTEIVPGVTLTLENCPGRYQAATSAVVHTRDVKNQVVKEVTAAQKTYDANPTEDNKKALTALHEDGVKWMRELSATEEDLRKTVRRCRKIFELHNKPLLDWMKTKEERKKT